MSLSRICILEPRRPQHSPDHCHLSYQEEKKTSVFSVQVLNQQKGCPYLPELAQDWLFDLMLVLAAFSVCGSLSERNLKLGPPYFWAHQLKFEK